jgi:ABC-type molybdate transport system substrate-binding protein
MRALVRAVLIAAMLLPLLGMADAAEIRVLAEQAPEAAIRALAADFAKDSGHQVALTIDSPDNVMQKIKANEVHDVAILAEPAMDRLDQEGVVNPESRVRLAKAGAADSPAAETYEAALMSDGAAVEASRAFIHFLASEDARPKWAAAGFAPLGDR